MTASSAFFSSRLPIYLGLVSVVLGGVLAFQLADEASPPVPPRVAEGTRERPAEPGEEVLPFAMPPIESYSEITDRPLFNRSRRPAPPPEPEEQGTPVAGGPGLYVLRGIIFANGRKYALVQSTRATRLVTIAEGQTVDNWTVESIEGDKVFIRENGTVTEVRLFDALKVPPPTEARRPPKRVATGGSDQTGRPVQERQAQPPGRETLTPAERQAQRRAAAESRQDDLSRRRQPPTSAPRTNPPVRPPGGRVAVPLEDVDDPQLQPPTE